MLEPSSNLSFRRPSECDALAKPRSEQVEAAGELTTTVGQRDACKPSHLRPPGRSWRGMPGQGASRARRWWGHGRIAADSRLSAKAKRTRGEPKRAQAGTEQVAAVNEAGASHRDESCRPKPLPRPARMPAMQRLGDHGRGQARRCGHSPRRKTRRSGAHGRQVPRGHD
jgi:hypothetical protein